MMGNAKIFDILATSLNVLYNYFDSPKKLFSDLYLHRAAFSYTERTLKDLKF